MRLIDGIDDLEATVRREARLVKVTIGKAARMLRMTRQGVLYHVTRGHLEAERVEHTRGFVWVLARAAVAAFGRLLQERRRRVQVVGRQLPLRLESTAWLGVARRPEPWRGARFTVTGIRPGRMLRAGEASQLTSSARRAPAKTARRA